MCVAVPGRVIGITEHSGSRMARVDIDGVIREVSLALLPGLRVDDWVIVHMGLAFRRLDEHEALETLGLLAEAGIREQEPA